jgi:hypothetical protein
MATTYTDPNVQVGKDYQYKVLSTNSAGTSSASTPVTAAIRASLSITVGKGANKSVQFTNDGGTVATITLRGQGDATVSFVGTTVLSQLTNQAGVVVTGSGITIIAIDIAGTTAGSSLFITTKEGSNTVNIGGISVNASINSITAPTAALIGTLAVTGSINRITLGSASAATVTIGARLGIFRAASVTDTALTVGGVIGSIVAGNWSSTSAISAASINSIAVNGNAQLNVVAGALRSLRVEGELDDSVFTLSAGGTLDLANLSAFSIVNTVLDTTGNIGTVSTSMLDDSQIYAGTGASGDVAFPPVGTTFKTPATIASINLRKVNGVFSDTNSSIAAMHISRLNLGNIQFSNGGTPFGIQALSINLLTAANPSVKPFAFHNLTSQAVVDADFAARNIIPDNFQIEII